MQVHPQVYSTLHTMLILMDIEIYMLPTHQIIEFNYLHKVEILRKTHPTIVIMFRIGSFTATTAAGTGSAGSALSQLNGPTDIYVDPNRNMYILDTTNYRVLRWKVGEPLGYVVAGGNSWGSALTQITTSYAIFVDSQRNVYVSENGNHRVTMWSPLNTTTGVLVRDIACLKKQNFICTYGMLGGRRKWCWKCSRSFKFSLGYIC